MEGQNLLLKTLRTFFLLAFIFTTIYFIRVAVNFYKDNKLFDNSLTINLKFLKSNNRAANAPKELILENINENFKDTIRLETLVPDKTKQNTILEQSQNETGVEMIIVQQEDGNIVIDNKKYASYSKIEYEEAKDIQKRSYMSSLLLTFGIMIFTFGGTAAANKVMNRKTRNRKSKPVKRK